MRYLYARQILFVDNWDLREVFGEKEEDDDDEPLKSKNIKSHTQENLINRLLSKRFTKKLIDLMLSNIITYDMNITSDDFVNKKMS